MKIFLMQDAWFVDCTRSMRREPTGGEQERNRMRVIHCTDPSANCTQPMHQCGVLREPGETVAAMPAGAVGFFFRPSDQLPLSALCSLRSGFEAGWNRVFVPALEMSIGSVDWQGSPPHAGLAEVGVLDERYL